MGSCRARRSSCRSGSTAATTRISTTPSDSSPKSSRRRAEKSVAVLQDQRTAAFDERRRQLRAWQDRVRDPSLTALLVLELCAIFLAVPLAAKGLPCGHRHARSCAL